MSTVSNTTDTNALSAIASQLFKKSDADNDGKLSAGEFNSFLESLLNKVGSSSTSTTSSTSAAKSAAAAATPKVYQGMLGFDYAKLNTPGHTSQKYVFARATQDLDFAWDRASRSAGLSRIADYMKANGYPETTVVGDDKLNFGGGTNDIDVLTGDGQWWWGA